MTMTPYDPALTRALRWLYNKAPNIQSLVNQKQAWYDRNLWQFWTNWEQTVFDLRTANSFGLKVWCIILGLPPSLFDFNPIDKAWAFGINRDNYISSFPSVAPIVLTNAVIYEGVSIQNPGNYTIDLSSGTITFNTAPGPAVGLSFTGTIENDAGQPTNIVVPFPFATGNGSETVFSLIPHNIGQFNTIGANFYGGGGQSVALLSEIKYALQLRYAALVSNGRQQWINYMLTVIFNKGVPWDLNGSPNLYFLLTDGTEMPSGNRVPVTKPHYMEYQVGPGMNLSSQFINLLNNQAYGIMPQCAGTSYQVVQH